MKISEISTENTAVSMKTDSLTNIVPHSDIKSCSSVSVTQQTHSVENNPEEFKSASYFPKVEEKVQQFLKEKKPDVASQPGEKNSYGSALNQFIEVYRSQPLDPQQVVSLLGLCHEIRSYIINCEKNNIAQGKLSINTMTAIKVCKELGNFPSEINGIDTYKITKNPLNNDCYSRLDNGEIIELFNFLKCEYNERTLTMLVGAGILMKDSIMKKFGSIEESVIKNKIVDSLISEGNVRNEIEGIIESVFSKMKSDAFVCDWINYGFPKDRNFMDCITYLGSCINLKYSNMVFRDLSGYNIIDCDLTGSSLDHCSLYGLNMINTVLKDVTMDGVNMADLYKNKDLFLESIVQLIASGVRKLPYYEPLSQEYSERFDSQS